MYPRRPRLTTWLATATVGVYLLVVVGATASLADAAQACSGWPACSGSLTETAVLVALGHRLAAAVVGLLVAGTAVVTLRSDATRRVKAAVLGALLLYPAQIGIGAVLARGAVTGTVPGLHLFVGSGIFGALLAGLAWQLEAETGTQAESTVDIDSLEPAPASGTGAGESSDGSRRPSGDRSGPARASLRQRAFAYFRLMKPRLMWLLCLVAAAAMALANGTDLTVRTVVLTLGGGVLAIGSSGTFNHVLERDRDKRMDRTSDRPVATHEIPERNAVAFGVALGVLSLAVFLQLNVLAATLGLIAIAFYSIIYTLVLKPNTAQNTVIGGAAGSLPALIGWAAATDRIGVAGLALAGVIFVWTPAHFYNLALAYRDDYEQGGFPMMPVVRGETTTRKHILLWAGATLVCTSGLIWLTNLGAVTTGTPLGWPTALTTTALGAVFLWAIVRLHREQTESAAFRAFHASNTYLGVLLVAIVVDTLAV